MEPLPNREQKKQIIVDYLRENMEYSDNYIGKQIGVSPTTIAKYRRQLESQGQIPVQRRLLGEDGKMRPRFIERD
jgi:hypothetical protein